MLERQVVVISPEESRGLKMVRVIRGLGAFCVWMRAGESLVLPPEARGAVVIGEEEGDAASAVETLRRANLPMLAFGSASASLCRALGGACTGEAFRGQLKDVHFAPLGVCADVEGGLRRIDRAEYLSLPQGCRTLSVCEGVLLAFEDEKGQNTGFQFLPEAHDMETAQILGNFLRHTLRLEADYSAETFIRKTTENLRRAVGDGQAVCVLSGGVDSTVAACLARRAVGDRLHCLILNKGLEQEDEEERIRTQICERMGLQYRRIDARARMMEKLRGCQSPEEKRAAVAQLVNERIAQEAARLGGKVTVIRATNYPDVLSGHSEPFREGGIPFAEPLRDLFKEEVRRLAEVLEVPEEIRLRPHYPSAGIALRCMGPVDDRKLSVLRTADEVLRESLRSSGIRKPNLRAFTVLTDYGPLFGSDEPRYLLAIRIVIGASEERPQVFRIPQDAADCAAESLMERVPHAWRVVYDLSPVPACRVEWE